MEKNRRVDQSKDQSYVRWLQRVVLEKEKELANINNNIKVEETRNEYEEQLQEKQVQLESLRHQIQIKDSLINKLLKAQDRREPKTQRTMLQADNLPMSSSIDSDRQLMKQLKKNQKKFEEAREGITRLAEQVETLQEGLVEEQRKNRILQQQFDILRDEKEIIKNQLDKCRQSELKNADKMTHFKNQAKRYQNLYEQQQQKNQLELSQKINEQIAVLKDQLQQEKLKRQLQQTKWQQQRTVYERELTQDREDYTREMMEQEQAKNKIIDRLKEEIEHLSRRNEEIVAKRQQIKHQLQIIKVRYSVLQSQLQSAKEDSLLISNKCIVETPKIEVPPVVVTPSPPSAMLTHKLSEANKTVNNLEQQIAQLVADKQAMMDRYSSEKSENTKKFKELTEEIIALRKTSEELSQQLQKSRKTTMEFIKQKQHLTSEVQHLKSSIRQLNSDIQTVRKSYKISAWFLELCQLDRTLILKVDMATTTWQVKYTICQNMVRYVYAAVNNQKQLGRLTEILKNVPVGDIPLIEFLLLICQHIMLNKAYKSTTQLMESEANIHSFMLEMSNIVMEDKLNKEEEALHEIEKRQQILLSDLEREVQENPSQIEMSAATDVSEIRENLNMVKAVNQQLFGEIQAKEQQLSNLMKKLKQVEDFNLKHEHLKANLQTAMKELKTSDRAFSIISKAYSLLQT